MRKSIGITLLMLAGLCVLVAAAGQASAQGEKAAIVWPAGDIKWTDNPAIKGAKIAVLWGDPAKGPYGAFRTLPAGPSLALHTHTNDQRVIAVSGAIVLSMEGGSPKELGPGSYAFIPGGAKHSVQCKAGAACTYFEEGMGASDIEFVQGAESKK